MESPSNVACMIVLIRHDDDGQERAPFNVQWLYEPGVASKRGSS